MLCVKLFSSNETVIHTFRFSVHNIQIAAVVYISGQRQRSVENCTKAKVYIDFYMTEIVTFTAVKYNKRTQNIAFCVISYVS
jgi:hypothetical protein